MKINRTESVLAVAFGLACWLLVVLVYGQCLSLDYKRERLADLEQENAIMRDCRGKPNYWECEAAWRTRIEVLGVKP